MSSSTETFFSSRHFLSNGVIVEVCFSVGLVVSFLTGEVSGAGVGALTGRISTSIFSSCATFATGFVFSSFFFFYFLILISFLLLKLIHLNLL